MTSRETTTGRTYLWRIDIRETNEHGGIQWKPYHEAAVADFVAEEETPQQCLMTALYWQTSVPVEEFERNGTPWRIQIWEQHTAQGDPIARAVFGL